MKALFNAILLIVIAVGVILFGSINDQPVRVDFFVRSFEWPLGWAMLLFFGVGMLLAGVIVWLQLRLALSRRLRELRRKAERADRSGSNESRQLTSSPRA